MWVELACGCGGVAAGAVLSRVVDALGKATRDLSRELEGLERNVASVVEKVDLERKLAITLQESHKQLTDRVDDVRNRVTNVEQHIKVRG